MYRWTFVALLLAALGASPLAAQAQQTNTNACGPLLASNVLPMLQWANRYNPSGIFPYGYAPLAQPFATNPREYALYGYPWQAYYNGYTYASPSPPFGSLLPTATASPELTADAVLNQLRSDGTWDQLSTLDRAEWLYRLGVLQQTEVGRQIEQAQLQRQAQIDMVNIRRVPFDLAIAYQNAARNWHDSYVFAAQTQLNTLQAACNPATGTLPPGSLPPFCPTPNMPVGPVCAPAR